MNSGLKIEAGAISLHELKGIIDSKSPIYLSEELVEEINRSRNALESILFKSEKPIYGINTGFGALCDTQISDDKLDELQINLIRSHACGIGEFLDKETAKLVLLLKIICLSKGNSAVRFSLVQFLIELYNRNITPCIPQIGSLGASGDLAPLAHLSLACIGEGSLMDDDKISSAAEIITKYKLNTPGLKSKEGLALLNGTQYSLALLIQNVWSARSLYDQSIMVAALSLEAFNGVADAFDPAIHLIRHQSGQIQAAKDFRKWLEGSDLMARVGKSVQDPYSFRCIPQVHGASLDAIHYVEQIAERELNAVTDNPLLIDHSRILSGGNFHAQPLALSGDFLSIAVAELGNISERRIYQLICGYRGLPDFLTADPGLSSGYMIVQYAAAALVSLNKQYASPASVDSIISSKGQEDHVSMAANAGIKCTQIVKNVQQVIAMEWMTAHRAWHYRSQWTLGSGLKQMFDKYNQINTFKEKDHIPSEDYAVSISFLKSYFN